MLFLAVFGTTRRSLFWPICPFSFFQNCLAITTLTFNCVCVGYICTASFCATWGYTSWQQAHWLQTQKHSNYSTFYQINIPLLWEESDFQGAWHLPCRSILWYRLHPVETFLLLIHFLSWLGIFIKGFQVISRWKGSQEVWWSFYVLSSTQNLHAVF